MNLISFDEYKEFIQKVYMNKYETRTIYLSPEDWKKSYESYVEHEKAWWEYFEDIFLPNFNPECSIQLVFMESGPGPKEKKSAAVSPQPSYAFTEPEQELGKGNKNSYLKGICYNEKCIESNPDFFLNLEDKSRKVVLKALSKKNFLIIDLFPTHGISIGKNQRKKLSSILEEYTTKKLNCVKKKIEKKIKKETDIFSRCIIYPAPLETLFAPFNEDVNLKILIKEMLGMTFTKKISFKAYELKKPQDHQS